MVQFIRVRVPRVTFVVRPCFVWTGMDELGTNYYLMRYS